MLSSRERLHSPLIMEAIRQLRRDRTLDEGQYSADTGLIKMGKHADVRGCTRHQFRDRPIVLHLVIGTMAWIYGVCATDVR